MDQSDEQQHLLETDVILSGLPATGVLVLLEQFVGLLPDAPDESGVAEHVWLEIVFCDDLDEIVDSLVDLAHPDVEVEDSVVRNEVDVELLSLHLLEQLMCPVDEFIVVIFFIVSHTHVDQLFKKHIEGYDVGRDV